MDEFHIPMGSVVESVSCWPKRLLSAPWAVRQQGPELPAEQMPGDRLKGWVLQDSG